MKKWKVAIAIFIGLVLLASSIYDFVTSDPVHYFSRQPRQILMVVAIAIASALLMAGFHRLPSLWRRRVLLFAWAMPAFCMTVASLLASFSAVDSRLFLDGSDVGAVLVFILFHAAVSGWLWFEFYRTYQKRLP